MKKKIIKIIIIIAIIIALFPIKTEYWDGGTRIYHSIVGIYQFGRKAKMEYGCGDDEFQKFVKIFGIPIYEEECK